MPFDANLVLHDGTTITADISPTSTTRSSGSAVLDVKESPAKGISVVLIMGADLAESGDTLLVTIEESTAEASGYVEVARFPLLTQGTGMPGTYILRCQIEDRYMRAKIDVTDSDSGGDFSVASCYILVSPYPFRFL